MKKFLLVAALAAFVGGCGAEWADCPTCQPGEDSAEGSDGTNIPVIVNVDVDVDVDQTQTQGQDQTQNQNNPPCTQCSTPDAGTPPSTPDAGTPPKPDAGTPDAGCPVCRKVCVAYVTRYVCKDGKDVSKKSDCKCGVKKEYKKCTKEEVKCS